MRNDGLAAEITQCGWTAHNSGFTAPTRAALREFFEAATANAAVPALLR